MSLVYALNKAAQGRGVCCQCKNDDHDSCKLATCSCCGENIAAEVERLHDRMEEERRQAALVSIAEYRKMRRLTKKKRHYPTVLLSWTHEARVAMYKELVKFFGPFSTWQCPKSRVPDSAGTLIGNFYNEWCRDWGNRMLEAQGLQLVQKADAVKQQIAWAITTQDCSTLSDNLKATRERNVAAAIEAGFL